MNISQIWPLILIVAIPWIVFRIPSSYMNAYVEWVHKKHGVMIVYSIGILMLLTNFGILMMLTQPGKNPMLELISFIIAFAITAIAALDNFAFWRTEYRKNN